MPSPLSKFLLTGLAFFVPIVPATSATIHLDTEEVPELAEWGRTAQKLWRIGTPES